MEQQFVGYDFKITPRDPFTDILIAELSLLEFDSFQEHEKGVSAYISEAHWHEGLLDDVRILKSEEVVIETVMRTIEQVNWNAVWETNFESIQVRNTVSIRAPFHDDPEMAYDIVIEPKMSFGTGHHETTHMMVEHLLEMELSHKKVLDMGCGTGILAIFAEMKGAAMVDAVDIDQWCYENSLENTHRNACSKVTVIQGGAEVLTHRKYDVVLANINRNVLIKDMATYVHSMRDNGMLILSGFYVDDFQRIDKVARDLGLTLEKRMERNKWLSLKYLK